LKHTPNKCLMFVVPCAIHISFARLPRCGLRRRRVYFNKVSSYSHHRSPRLSGYSVHNICSSGKGVIPNPRQFPVSLKWGL
jgi:hypothetical protein